MVPLFEIRPCPKGRLAIMPRPSGGKELEEELWSMKDFGVSALVSCLVPEEESELGLTKEAQLCTQVGLPFYQHPIRDRGLPREPEFGRFVDSLLPLLEQGGFVAVHCRAGIGRSASPPPRFFAALASRRWKPLSAFL